MFISPLTVEEGKMSKNEISRLKSIIYKGLEDNEMVKLSAIEFYEKLQISFEVSLTSNYEKITIYIFTDS